MKNIWKFKSIKKSINKNNDVILVWEHDYNIFKFEKFSGIWSENPEIINEARAAELPKVVMDDNGDAIIVWSQNNDNLNQNQYRRKTDNHERTPRRSMDEPCICES